MKFRFRSIVLLSVFLFFVAVFSARLAEGAASKNVQTAGSKAKESPNADSDDDESDFDDDDEDDGDIEDYPIWLRFVFIAGIIVVMGIGIHQIIWGGFIQGTLSDALKSSVTNAFSK